MCHLYLNIHEDTQTEPQSETTSTQNIKEKSKAVTNNTKWGKAQENLQNDLRTQQTTAPVQPEQSPLSI